MKDYARFDAEGLLETTLLGDDDLEWGRQQGFKPLVIHDEIPAVSGLQKAELIYSDEGGRIVGRYEVRENHPELVRAEIDRLKKELASGDYRVAKCAECMLLGLPAPYDAAALHATREGLRAEINRLEQLPNRRFGF